MLTPSELPSFQASIAAKQGAPAPAAAKPGAQAGAADAGAAAQPGAQAGAAAGAAAKATVAGKAGAQAGAEIAAAAEPTPLFTIEHKYTGTLKLGMLFAFLPATPKALGLEIGTNGDAEVEFEVTCTFKTEEFAKAAGSIAKSAENVLSAIRAGDMIGAVKALFSLKADGDSELLAFIASSVDEVKLTSKVGLTRGIEGGTPGEGTVSGAEGEASVSAFTTAEATLDAAALGLPSVVRFLRNFV